ncbi:MAG: RHS repeat-associated core domain-containing protein [Acidobacteria bacterium]|nr:RHS repeat-associated core domain-containing protein [Acidobacteriota bacterium]
MSCKKKYLHYEPFLNYSLQANSWGRTSAMGYAGDSVRQKYTGYERDAETGLNFAEARYHSDVQGRFTSVDPLSSSAKLTDPQSLNRYAYVGNSPVVFSDPSGMNAQPGSFNIHNYSGGMAAEMHSEGLSPWPDVPVETAVEAVESGDPSGTVMHEAGHSLAVDSNNQNVGVTADTDNKPNITDMVTPNGGVDSSRFWERRDGTMGHDGGHVLGDRAGSKVSAIAGLTGTVLTWYRQGYNQNSVYILLPGNKLVMVLKDLENLSSLIKRALARPPLRVWV